MTLPTREQVYGGVFALVSNGEGLDGTGKIAWTDPLTSTPGTFKFTSRRPRQFDRIPVWPALIQMEHDEVPTDSRGMPQRRVWKVSWFIYHSVGSDDSAVPAQTTNAILDALDALFPPNDIMMTQTLGGLVHKVWIDGTIEKFQGDNEAQALLVVPLSIIVP